MSDVFDARSAGEFDLQPDPRVLPMLGEINLEPWRCVAELIDNSVDGFLHAQRAGAPIEDPEVIVQLPTVANPNARVQVRDNGPGMSAAVLESAVRAGWTGNNPVDNLGLFGMGFNIATARLGLLTRVWTTRAGDNEWHGVGIDFDELRHRRSFRTPHLIRSKTDPSEHGTEVTIERLKPDHLQNIARTASQSRIRDQLAKSYAAILRPNGTPIGFSFQLNGRPVPGRSHCVWGENRSINLPNVGEVPAVITFNAPLQPRMYCLNCMRWLGADEVSCGPQCEVQQRTRRVHGWVGLQRYLSDADYGLDFIRNGRKIEIGVKELFEWPSDGVAEPEYPIDDPRKRGRIVGEIHIDHCRVHYDKTRFERTDWAWAEMVRVVRGEGPLRPERANQLGYGPNASPMYRLYQAYRRSVPRQRGGNGWTTRLLVVKDNARAQEMAQLFHQGHSDYQDDSKWWELAQAEELNDFRGTGGASGHPEIPEGFVDPEDDAARPPSSPPSPAQPAPANPPSTIVRPPAPPARERLPDLSRRYEVTGGPQVQVQSFAVARSDPGLGSLPWAFDLASAATRVFHFLVDPEHAAFRSATFSPRDALLAELARHVADFTRGSGAPIAFAVALADLRRRYAAADELDPTDIIREAEAALVAVARSIRGTLDEETCAALFAELQPEEQQAVFRRMAQRGVTTPAALVADGGFVEFLDRQALRHFFENHPELFLDGRYWEDPYSALDFGDAVSTALARKRAADRYASLLADAAWTADLDPTDLARRGREELIRAAISVQLLRPDVEIP